MKVYLMDTNAGRSMIINEDNKWYYFPYAINAYGIDCDDVHEAIENLERHIKTRYSNGNAIDINNFEHMSEYDALSAWSLLHAINIDEIRQGIIQEDLTTLYYICDTDTIKRGEN